MRGVLREGKGQKKILARLCLLLSNFVLVFFFFDNFAVSVLDEAKATKVFERTNDDAGEIETLQWPRYLSSKEFC